MGGSGRGAGITESIETALQPEGLISDDPLPALTDCIVAGHGFTAVIREPVCRRVGQISGGWFDEFEHGHDVVKQWIGALLASLTAIMRRTLLSRLVQNVKPAVNRRPDPGTLSHLAVQALRPPHLAVQAIASAVQAIAFGCSSHRLRAVHAIAFGRRSVATITLRSAPNDGAPPHGHARRTDPPTSPAGSRVRA